MTPPRTTRPTHTAPVGPSPIPVSDPDDPRVAAFLNLRDAHLARRHPADPDRPRGIFIAEGHAVVRTLLASRFETLAVLATERRAHTIAQDVPPHTPFYVMPDDAMNRLVGFDIHRGVLAAGRRSPDPTIKDLLDGATCIVALEGLSNHDNVGSMFRLAAALGREHPRVLLDPTCCDPLYRKAIRVSMGHALRVPFARTASLPNAIHAAHAAGFDTIALETADDALDITALPPPKGPYLLALGAEGPGLTDATLAAVRTTAHIKMSAGVASLNVATAAAIALHHLSA